MPSRQRRSARVRVISLPRKRTTPAEGRNEPASTLSRVVFPAPLGPTTPTASSAPTRKSTPSSTTSAPKRWLTPAASRIGVAVPTVPTGSTVFDQAARYGDVRIRRVLANDEVQRVLAPTDLAPLTADNRRRHHIG